MYYCAHWVERLGAESSGHTLDELWDEYHCEDINGTQSVYLGVDGDTQDTGNIYDEECSTHHNGVTWEDNVYDVAYNDMVNQGWFQCEVCEDGNGVARRDIPFFITEEDRLAHLREEHRPRGEDPRAATAPTTQDDWPLTREQIERAENLPPRPTWPSPLTLNDPWHIEPAVSATMEGMIRAYLRTFYSTNYSEHPSNVFAGIRVNAAMNTFTMVRTEADMLIPSNGQWTLHRFMPGPTRTTRSTASMWETPA